MHLPLFTGWEPSLISDNPLFLARCMTVDAFLAVATLVLAIWLAGNLDWPNFRYWSVGSWTIVFGVVLTVLLEWLNVYFLGTWAYSNLMPVMPLLDVGMSPLLQWVLVPVISLWWARPCHGALSSARN